METTEQQRAEWLADTRPGFPGTMWGKNARALCCDVDTLVAALRRQICPGHADVPGPETPCEFGDRHCTEARAVLG